MSKVEHLSVEDSIQKAFDLFLAAEGNLLAMDPSERSITSAFARYLVPMFPEWDVDCEYNRTGTSPKRLNVAGTSGSSGDSTLDLHIPDIIVHKRNTDQNLLVIEAKKSNSRVSTSIDLNKLKRYKKQLGYKHAFFIVVPVGADFQDRKPEVRLQEVAL